MSGGTLFEVEELTRCIDDPRLRVFDCRFNLAQPEAGRAGYAAGHLPGALYADLNRDLSAPVTASSGRHPLPEPRVFETRLRASGVNGDSIVVAYDDGNGMFAARLWWMMRWVGHNSSFVLNGGLRRWIELGLPLDTRTPASSDGDFVARPQPGHIAEADEVLAASRDATRRILDARAAERYRGEIETIDAVAGHVPGARNHPFASSVASDGRFRTAEEIRAAIESSLDGVPPARTIAMCGSGVTACHLLLAMEHAGRTGARLYAGSWSEWLRDRARPVATGPEP